MLILDNLVEGFPNSAKPLFLISNEILVAGFVINRLNSLSSPKCAPLINL